MKHVKKIKRNSQILTNNLSFTEFTDQILSKSKILLQGWAGLWVCEVPAALAPKGHTVNILSKYVQNMLKLMAQKKLLSLKS